MGVRWQCPDCGGTYLVAWLSNCPRCEALPRSRPRPKAEPKRRKRMPQITRTGGPSNAGALPGEVGYMGDVVLEDAPVTPAAEPVAAPEPEPAVEPISEPVAPPVVEPEPVVAPLPVVAAPGALPDLAGGAA